MFRLERTNIKATYPSTNRLVPIGTQRTDGLELTLTGQLPDGWQIWSGYAWLDARVTSSPAVDNSDNVIKVVRVQGKRATLTPRHSANVWLAKDFGPGLRAGAGLTYMSDRFANPGNTVVLPGFTTVDAMMGGRLGQFDLQTAACRERRQARLRRFNEAGTAKIFKGLFIRTSGTYPTGCAPIIRG